MSSFSLDEDLAASFAALSASAARNRLFSQKAKAEAKPQTAVVFAAMAEGEEIMARRALTALRGKVSALDEYRGEIAETKKQAAERFAERARAAGDKGAQSEADAYARFQAVSENHGGLLSLGEEERGLYVCRVCGYVALDEAPERCPVCNAVAKKFKAQDA